MAYTFVVNESNSVTASRKETIMQRSKLVNDIWFLVNPEYGFNDMTLFSVILEYVLPVSRKYRTVELTKDDEGYNGYLKYVVPIDTDLSSEAGDVEMQLTFAYVGLEPDGTSIQRVRKTMVCNLHVTPIAAWSDIIPDEALSSLDQRIIKIDAQIKHLNEMGDVFDKTKADNIRYDAVENSIQLTAKGREIGDEVRLQGGGGISPDGVPVIDLNGDSTSPDVPDVPADDCQNDVVEF